MLASRGKLHIAANLRHIHRHATHAGVDGLGLIAVACPLRAADRSPGDRLRGRDRSIFIASLSRIRITSVNPSKPLCVEFFAGAL